MKYSCQIEINAPIDQVIAKFDNLDNLKEWMEGLISFEAISGEPGQVGAKSKLLFQMGKRQIEMIETITVRDLPREFSGTYEAQGVFNIVQNYFETAPNGNTIYKTDQEFQFKGFMKFIGLLMPGAFKKQSMKYLISFKNFVERG